jgi:hypothetical protein
VRLRTPYLRITGMKALPTPAHARGREIPVSSSKGKTRAKSGTVIFSPK